MRLIITLLILVFSCFTCSAQRTSFLGSAGSAPIWSQGYWSASGAVVTPIADIDWRALTHVLMYAAIPNADGTVDVTTLEVSANAAALIAAAHANNVRTSITLYQANFGGHASTDFHDAITNHRTAFNTNIMNVVNTYGFDGVDINWENYTGDTALFTQLMGDLRSNLGNSRTLTAAVPTNDAADRTYWGANHTFLDRLNLQTYDLYDNCANRSWHTAPVYDNVGHDVWSVDLAKTRYVGAGVPASKFGIGIVFQGFQSTGGTPTLNGPNIVCTVQPTSFTQINYYDISPQIGVNGTYMYDSTAEAPYLSGNSGANSWLTYENAVSIAAKIAYVKTNHLGGWIIWNIDTDYIPAANPKNPLLNAVKTGLR